MSQPEPVIVIGVPGKWSDRAELLLSIARKSGGYLAAGNMLMHAESRVSFEIDIYEHDPTLAEKVRKGAMGQISESDLVALKDHTFTVYVLADSCGRDVVANMVDAVSGLLDAGGIVAKIEKAGFSVSAETWKKHSSVKAAYSLYRSMVTLVGSGTEYFTCGMSAFALPDCAVHGAELNEAFNVSTEFCCYLLDESPKFADGHTFSVSKDAPRYRVSFDDYTYYPSGNNFHNPNGLWKLVKVE